ncbi:MAG: hypothetical protein ACOYM3_12075 [Terrimicrobiaceae bacterium]
MFAYLNPVEFSSMTARWTFPGWFLLEAAALSVIFPGIAQAQTSIHPNPIQPILKDPKP